MNRREILGALGGAAAVMTAFGPPVALADDKTKDHEHHDDHDECAEECAECANECSSCSGHCAELLAGGHKEHLKTMRYCADCAELCSAAAKIVSRSGPQSNIVCEACLKSCEQCATECERFPMDKHMAECAEACRECATECRKMLKTS
jgi:Domain of Unknown Function (DUF326)